jgi:hypothetical protein
VAFEEPELLVAEAEGRLASVALEPEQTLVSGLDVMTPPNASNATRADADVLEAQLVQLAEAPVGNCRE